MPKRQKGDAEAEARSGSEVSINRLVNVLALLLVQGKKQVEQIDVLGRAGFSAAQIATLLGTTRNTVSVALSNRRKKKKR